MKIQINDTVHELNTESAETLSQLVGIIETEILTPLEEVITSIEVNDSNLSDEDEIKFADFPTVQIQTLKIESCKPTKLVLDGLNDCAQVLPKVIETLESCVEKLSHDDINEAMNDFIVVTDGIQWFTTIFNGALSIYDTKINEQTKFVQIGMRLTELLNEILEAHSNSDLTQFSDLLEYELSPLIEEIISEAPSFRKELEGIQL